MTTVSKYGKYSVNDEFFKVIDNEDKAYFLGFLYADGYISKNNINLEIIDLDILKILKNKIDYNGPIYIKSKNKKFLHRRQIYGLTISRQKIVNDVINLGCDYRKSLSIKFPSKNQVPEKFINHFIRGWFDGDGSIYKDNQDHWKVNFVGTKELLSGIIDTIKIGGYWNQDKESKDNNKNTWKYYIGKQSEIAKFLSFIYQDATIYLQRKFDKYQQYLSESPTNSSPHEGCIIM